MTATSQLCQSRNHHCTLQGLESWPLLNWVQQNSQAMLSSVHELHGNLLDIRWACILIVEVLFSYPDHFPHGFLNQCFLFKALGLQIWCAVLKYVLFLLCGCNCSEHQHPFCKPETVPPLHLSFLFFFPHLFGLQNKREKEQTAGLHMWWNAVLSSFLTKYLDLRGSLGDVL